MINKLINKVVSTVRYTGKAYKAAFDIGVELGTTKDPDTIIKLVRRTSHKGQNLSLFISDLVVLSSSGILPTIPGAVINKKADIGVGIFINTAAANLPKDQLQGILAHELGHLELGHLDNKLAAVAHNLMRKFKLYQGIPELEKGADAFAARTGNKEGLLAALKTISQTAKAEGLNINEIDLRVKELEQ